MTENFNFYSLLQQSDEKFLPIGDEKLDKEIYNLEEQEKLSEEKNTPN
jgi:hypothetical protein